MPNFANGSLPVTFTLDAIRETAEKFKAIGPAPGPWTVAKDIWDAMSASDARAGDLYLDVRLPPGTYYEGKPGEPRPAP